METSATQDTLAKEMVISRANSSDKFKLKAVITGEDYPKVYTEEGTGFANPVSPKLRLKKKARGLSWESLSGSSG